MSLSWKGGVESKWPREGVVPARISVDEWGHGQMNRSVRITMTGEGQ